MAKIRSATPEDIPRIVELYCRVFGDGSPTCRRALTPFLENVMMRSPWKDDELSSLACEGSGGELLGFLGSFHRPMRFRGETIRAAVSNLFMVEPSPASGLAALQLLQAFFRGPQDLSIADGNASSRKLWERLGGQTSLLYSLNWVRPLRPAQYLASQMGLGEGLRAAARPLMVAADAAAARLRPNELHRSLPGISEEPLDAHRHLEVLEQVGRDRDLVPIYQESSLEWVLEIFKDKASYGDLHRVLVRGKSGEVLGAYVYYCKAGEVAKVLQLVAGGAVKRDVLRSLWRHAWSRGAIAVSGGLDPAMTQELTDEHSFMGQTTTWTLLHGRPDVLESFDRGRALLSRLESEWMFYRVGISGGYG